MGLLKLAGEEGVKIFLEVKIFLGVKIFFIILFLVSFPPKRSLWLTFFLHIS